MLALKLLHISAVIVWCGSLLYVPFAMAGDGREVDPPLARRHLLRRLFTHLVTPLALVAIASGSAIFLLQGPTEPWLMAKLVLVALMVLCHGACGLLILRSERRTQASAAVASPVPRQGCMACWSLLVAVAALLPGIAWLVLYKPSF